MKKFTFILLLLVSNSAFSSPKALCGADDREYSYNNKVGRVVRTMNDTVGCTATLISDSCAITAGHCASYLKYMEFEVAHPVDGKNPEKKPENIYEIDQDSIVYQNEFNADWTVFKVKKNQETHKFPGELYGHYDVSYQRPFISEIVEITSYGEDDRPGRSYLQQVAYGEVTKGKVQRNATIFYQVDTTAGSSGAAVVLMRSNEIIGIHSKGGCDGRGYSNFGNFIGEVPELKMAIRKCLEK